MFIIMELIVAKNNKNYIGKDNTLMWHYSEDLNYFKKITHENIIVMGRKTYDSLPIKPLKNRIHVIITSEPNKYLDNNKYKNVYYITLDKSVNFLENLRKVYKSKIIIIGGSNIYEYFFSYCTKLHITYVDNDDIGDVLFPIDEAIIEKYYNVVDNKRYEKLIIKTFIINKNNLNDIHLKLNNIH